MESSVKLIAITKPVGELENLSSEELLAFVARVSNPTNQMNNETAPKLLGYCAKNEHWSVFEHSYMTLEIHTSRGITAQILRHRSFCFQEFSQRYAKATEFIKYPARRQDNKNRQNSIDDMSEEDQKWFEDAQQTVINVAVAGYEEALKRGIAKEQARFLLPLNTKSVIYMTGNVRSWIHYIALRSGNGTQKEHRDVALGAKKIFMDNYPSISQALDWKLIHDNLMKA